MKYSMGSLDEPVPADKPFVMPGESGVPQLDVRRKSLKAVVDSRIYPDFMDYHYAARLALDQGQYGICYICTACNFAKFVTWLHTGKLLPITVSQAIKVAKETRGDDWNEGGWAKCCSGLLTYPDSDCECITKFKQICSARGITASNLYAGSNPISKDNAIKTLNIYGPFYLSHSPLAYYPHDGSHAILAIGYDKDYLYFKNSWSSNDTCTDYHLYGKMTWEKFKEHGHGIHMYNANIWKNL